MKHYIGNDHAIMFDVWHLASYMLGVPIMVPLNVLCRIVNKR